ncbi:MAG: M23 family metallopeptidase [Gammaproteobacteria bacterium]|nr:M23 family metallopeptidase [Gammaproteobacteria bacterium]
MRSRIKILIYLVVVLVVGYLLPEKPVIPVAGATPSDWNKDSFWYEPWGDSGVHKGIDIFARMGTDLVSATNGVVLFKGVLSKGGNVVLVLGPKWRLHYYAHLNTISTNSFSIVSAGKKIGSVGDSGNAKGKQPHVHYSIVSMLPYFWQATTDSQGWKKMFFFDPGLYLTSKGNG